MIEIVSKDRCIGCDRCVEVCPTNVFDPVPGGAPRIARQQDCQTCFMCEVWCPVDALFVAPLSHPAPRGSLYTDEAPWPPLAASASTAAGSAGARGAAPAASGTATPTSPSLSSAMSTTCTWSEQPMTFTTRRRLAAIALLTVTGLLTAACGSSTSTGSGGHGSAGFTLRVGFISTTGIASGPEGWASRHGTLLPRLRPAGVAAIQWVPFKNGPDLNAAMDGGSLDLGLLGDTPALIANASGLPTRLVNQDAVGLDAWLFAKKHGPRSVAELAGTTVATQVGSDMYRYLLGVLQQQGIAGKVRVTHVYTSNALAALQSGQIAAYAAPAGQLTALLGAQGFPVLDKASVDHRDLLGTSVTVVTEKALAAHPALPQAWNGARAAAVADIAQHADAYYAFAATAQATPVAVERAARPVSSYPSAPFTAQGFTLLKATKDFLVAQRLAPHDVDLDAWKVPSPTG